MAKERIDTGAQVRKVSEDIRRGVFAPVYLLMGDEPFYPEKVCREIIANCVPEEEKDFNETICFGADVTTDQVITAARRYPMMADRQLVVVKEAQMLKDIENLTLYCAEPLETTVLVLLLRGASLDKRKGLYKCIQKCGVTIEGQAMRDYEMPGWIASYYEEQGLRIDPQAASLLAEYAGTDMSTIALETDKLLKALPEKTHRVTVEDIERNVGISRQYSIFELTKELSYKNRGKALTIARHIGNSAKFAMPMAVSALYNHFYRILKYDALLSRGGYPVPEEKARVLGVNPYFFREYDQAARNYPLRSAMAAVSLLSEYDYLGKGGDGAATAPDELLVELTSKLLNL